MNDDDKPRRAQAAWTGWVMTSDGWVQVSTAASAGECERATLRAAQETGALGCSILSPGTGTAPDGAPGRTPEPGLRWSGWIRLATGPAETPDPWSWSKVCESDTFADCERDTNRAAYRAGYLECVVLEPATAKRSGVAPLDYHFIASDIQFFEEEGPFAAWCYHRPSNGWYCTRRGDRQSCEARLAWDRQHQAHHIDAVRVARRGQAPTLDPEPGCHRTSGRS
jgi:hypothetical protein